MRSPEEVVDEFAADQDTAPGWGMSEADRDRLADLIRARDAELAEDAFDRAVAQIRAQIVDAEEPAK